MDKENEEKLFAEEPGRGDDEQLFSDSEEKTEETKEPQAFRGTPWKIMVVDDEADIHSVTKIALKSFSFMDRGVEFIHAHSAEESKPLLNKNRDIALILLDVVMETPTAGLDLVKYIRDELNYQYTQIILRTGYPGYAPEREVIVSYEINDYKTKTELTAFKLFTLTLASLRAFHAVMELENLRAGLEEKVRNRTAELEKKNLQIMEMDQMKTRFFSNVSHEFRTPLTLILSPLEDILSREQMSDKNRVVMERMHRNALRLLALINQLLDLSKLDAGNMKLNLMESDLFRTLRLLTSSFHTLADKKQITYDLKIPDGELQTSFDPDKLEKILTNLLSNAFKYTPEGGFVNCHLKIVKRGKNKDKDFLQIQVDDSGPGIPPELADKIFDRFYQVEGSWQNSTGGTGIGLSLTRELVDLQHGELKLESEEGEGTSFTVLLPVGKEHLKEDEYELMELEDLDHSLSSRQIISESEQISPEDFLIDEQNGKPSLVLVEDDPDVRAHLIENLSELFNIAQAVDGEEGMKLVTEQVPDLVISDLMMPKMDGVEMCRNLKSDERTSHIPVIMLTAKDAVESKIEGLETGADAYLTKPFNLKELVAHVNALVDQRKKLREKFATDSDAAIQDIAVTSVDEKFLRKAIDLIEEKMGDSEFDVTAMTEQMGMSRMQLFRKLKALTAQTPSEFIRTIRLKRAAHLIKKKFGNVAEITYEVGFNNLSYFAKCFKELYGLSPSEYAKT